MRAFLAASLTLVAACAFGLVSGLAGRVVLVFGLYEVAAAITLAVLAAAVHHLARHRPGRGRFVLAALAAVVWLGAHQLIGAWAFRQEQARIVADQADTLTADFLASGAESPLQLVDLGLRADTGADGVRGALLAQSRAGVVVQQAFGAARVVPVPRWGFALVLAGEAAFVALVLARALAHLGQEPVCARCGRFLRRRRLGAVGEYEVARLHAAWAGGTHAPPNLAADPQSASAVIYEDTCPAGHSLTPGWAAVRLRKRNLSSSAPGPVASLPPVLRAP